MDSYCGKCGIEVCFVPADECTNNHKFVKIRALLGWLSGLVAGWIRAADGLERTVMQLMEDTFEECTRRVMTRARRLQPNHLTRRANMKPINRSPLEPEFGGDEEGASWYDHERAVAVGRTTFKKALRGSLAIGGLTQRNTQRRLTALAVASQELSVCSAAMFMQQSVALS